MNGGGGGEKEKGGRRKEEMKKGKRKRGMGRAMYESGKERRKTEAEIGKRELGERNEDGRWEWEEGGGRTEEKKGRR